MKCGTQEACGGCEISVFDVRRTTATAMSMAAESIVFMNAALGVDSLETQQEAEATLHDLYICPDMTEEMAGNVKLAVQRIRTGNCN